MRFAERTRSRRKRESLSLMYSGLHDIPFFAFVGMYCDGDMSMLYRDGKRPKRPMEEAEKERSEEITLAFADMVNSNSEGKSKLNTIKRRECERMNAVILSCAIQTYSSGTDEMTAKSLKRLHIRLTGDPEHDLTLMNARLSECLRKYKEYSEDTDKINGGGDTIDRAYFHRLMASVCIYFKFSIPNDIPMLTFCEYVNQMRESANQRAKAAKKNRKPVTRK